LSFKVTT